MTVTIKMRIRAVRKAQGLTIVKLAEISGVSVAHISDIERGKKMPTLPIICVLACALGVDARELYDYEQKKISL